MQNKESSLADVVHAPRSDRNASSGGVQLSANMTRRLENLALWRIDSSLITFPKSGPNSEGGCAVVSRALLASSSDDSEDQLGESKTGNLASSSRTPGVLKAARKGTRFSPYSKRAEHPTQSIRNPVRTLRSTSSSLKNSKTPGEGGNPDNQTAADEQEHESDGETSGRRKAVAVKKMKVKTRVDVVRVLGLTIREAEFLIGLSHENIIKLEGFVEDLSKNMIWLVFPWEENGTLKDFIASAEWEIPERISLLYEVAKGVEYLHSRKPPLCHGDLKSVNILVNSECRTVITDFGSARHPTTKGPSRERGRAQNDPQPATSPEATFCPSTNTITLNCNGYTLRWAAPELLEEDDASLASDVWAFGCVAYEVMTNSIPFQGVKDAIVVMRVVRGDLPSISSDARMALIQALCTLVKQCWSVDPSKRPTAEDCRGEIAWMPMITPNPVRTAGALELAGRSADLVMQLGQMHGRQGDYPNASKYFAEALNLYANLADSNEKANALLALAQVHRLQNEYSQAVTFYSECLQIKTDLGDRSGRADALLGLAAVHGLQNKYSQAVTFYSECLQIKTDLGDRSGRANALWGLAEVHRGQNEYSQAVTFYSECLQIKTDLGDRRGRAQALLGLAEVHRLRTEYSQALIFLSDALKASIDISDISLKALTLLGIANTHRDQGHHCDAIHHYEQAAELLQQIGQSRIEGYARQRAADARRLLEHNKAAQRFADQTRD